MAVAREYGFASWAKLKTEVDRREILDTRDVTRLNALLAEHPELAVEPIGLRHDVSQVRHRGCLTPRRSRAEREHARPQQLSGVRIVFIGQRWIGEQVSTTWVVENLDAGSG